MSFFALKRAILKGEGNQLSAFHCFCKSLKINCIVTRDANIERLDDCSIFIFEREKLEYLRLVLRNRKRDHFLWI